MSTIQVVGLMDEPYSFSCFPFYSPLNYTKCKRPGLEIEYIHMILVHMMHLEIQWVVASSYAEMTEVLKK